MYANELRNKNIHRSNPQSIVSHGTFKDGHHVQLAALPERAAEPAIGHTCSLCRRSFPQKKTLDRHMGTVHHPNLQLSFVCATCGLAFKRKDILIRHRMTQHGEQRKVQCSICRRRLRPRALAQHWNSRVCREAAKTQTDNNSNRALRAVAVSAATRSTSVPGALPAVMDLLLISVWLFTKLRPWGRGQESHDIWLLKSRVVAPSVEVLELNGLAYRSITKALHRYVPGREEHLCEAIMIVSIAECFLNGFDKTMSHRLAIVFLEQQKMALAARSGQKPSWSLVCRELFLSVLSRKVGESEAKDCWEVIGGSIEVVRASAHLPGDRMNKERWASYHAARLLHLARLASSIGSGALKS